MIVFAGIVWKIAMRIQMDAVIHAARIRMNVNRYASVHLGGITIIKISGTTGERENMKRLFISQPMVDRTDEEIISERKVAIAEAKKLLNEDIEVIDSFTSVQMNPLGYLGYSITCLSKADVAYFAKGWQDYRGCRIEHICAVDYGIQVIFSEFDPHKTTIGKRLDAGLFD